MSNDLFRGHEPLAPRGERQWRFPLIIIQGQVVVPRLRDELNARAREPLPSKLAPVPTLAASRAVGA